MTGCHPRLSHVIVVPVVHAGSGRRLKMELERCMSVMADKRVLVSELEQRSCVLQGEVDRLAFQLDESRSKAERLQASGVWCARQLVCWL